MPPVQNRSQLRRGVQNSGGVLPIRSEKIKTIAVVGAAAEGKVYDPNTMGSWQIGDLYSGGGSGHVVAGSVVTTLAGLRKRATAAGPSYYTFLDTVLDTIPVCRSPCEHDMNEHEPNTFHQASSSRVWPAARRTRSRRRCSWPGLLI